MSTLDASALNGTLLPRTSSAAERCERGCDECRFAALHLQCMDRLNSVFIPISIRGKMPLEGER